MLAALISLTIGFHHHQEPPKLLIPTGSPNRITLRPKLRASGTLAAPNLRALLTQAGAKDLDRTIRGKIVLDARHIALLGSAYCEIGGTCEVNGYDNAMVLFSEATADHSGVLSVFLDHASVPYMIVLNGYQGPDPITVELRTFTGATTTVTGTTFSIPIKVMPTGNNFFPFASIRPLTPNRNMTITTVEIYPIE